MSDTTTDTMQELVAPAFRAALAAAIAQHLEPRRYPFPAPIVGDTTEIAVRLLTDREIDSGRIEAQRFCGRLKIDLDTDPDFLEREVQRQIVWRSVLEPFPGKDGKHPPLFPSDADVRELPATIVEALHRLYLEHQDRVSPLLSVSESSVDALVESIRSGGPVALSALDHDSLVRVAIALAKDRR